MHTKDPVKSCMNCWRAIKYRWHHTCWGSFSHQPGKLTFGSSHTLHEWPPLCEAKMFATTARWVSKHLPCLQTYCYLWWNNHCSMKKLDEPPLFLRSTCWKMSHLVTKHPHNLIKRNFGRELRAERKECILWYFKVDLDDCRQERRCDPFLAPWRPNAAGLFIS